MSKHTLVQRLKGVKEPRMTIVDKIDGLVSEIETLKHGASEVQQELRNIKEALERGRPNVVSKEALEIAARLWHDDGTVGDVEYIRADVAKAERDELLEALKLACDLVEDIDNDTSDHAMQRCDAVIPMLTAAIAKAEG